MDDRRYVRYFQRFVGMVRDHPNRPVLIFVMLWDQMPFTLPHPHTTIHDRLRPLLGSNQLVVDVAKVRHSPTLYCI